MKIVNAKRNYYILFIKVVFKHKLLHILHKIRCFSNLINLSHFGYLSKESLNSDGQQFQQYQKLTNNPSTEIIEHKTKNTTCGVGNPVPGLG